MHFVLTAIHIFLIWRLVIPGKTPKTYNWQHLWTEEISQKNSKTGLHIEPNEEFSSRWGEQVKFIQMQTSN